MAWDLSRDTALRGSHAPRVGAGESRAGAATLRMEGTSATATADGDGPDLLGRAVEALEEFPGLFAGGVARDCGSVAPSGLQALLGMEESTPMGSARDWEGSAGSHSADEPRQSSLGCPTNPRRAAEAGPDGLAGDGFEVHAPAAEAAVTGVAHVSEEPRPGSDRVGFLHGPDRDLSSAVCAGGVAPRAAAAAAFQYHGASDRRVDGATTDRGVRAGGQPSVSDPGSGPGLWRTIFASGQDVGHPGDGHSATIAVAKRLCRARDWLDSTRMSGPYRGNRGEASAGDSVELRRLLQRDPDTLSAGQRCARAAECAGAEPGQGGGGGTRRWTPSRIPPACGVSRSDE